MEETFRLIASYVALLAEFLSVVCVAVGTVAAVVRVFQTFRFGQAADAKARRDVFVGFAGWIILALEFALGADIVRTAIAPTWDQIGQLAAIATIRTALNFFLEREVAAREAQGEASGGSSP